LEALDLPPPDPSAAALSARLVTAIATEIERCGGWLGFDRYMEMALYEPGLGYYSAGSTKLGAEGDFVTAPELSTLFGAVIARQIRATVSGFDRPIVLELGAGTGRLAKSVLDALGGTVGEYWILELSADLRARQREMLAPHANRIRWLDSLPEQGFEGFVLANEVADALPVEVFVRRRDGARQIGVGLDATGLRWIEAGPDPAFAQRVDALETSLGWQLPDGYRSELSSRLPAWIAGLAAPLDRGAVLLIDYGLPRREYYLPERAQGTLICHYRHRAHFDPLFAPGLQDISAWVDFSACADAAETAGLGVAGYTTQAQFLLHGGAAELLERLPDEDREREARALKTLVMPGEMGERFKLLLLARGEVPPLPGRDFRDRL
jgi:SAM-dependent MidA family methyltransferase